MEASFPKLFFRKKRFRFLEWLNGSGLTSAFIVLPLPLHKTGSDQMSRTHDLRHGTCTLTPVVRSLRAHTAKWLHQVDPIKTSVLAAHAAPERIQYSQNGVQDHSWRWLSGKEYVRQLHTETGRQSQDSQTNRPLTCRKCCPGCCTRLRCRVAGGAFVCSFCVRLHVCSCLLDDVDFR